MASSDRNYYDSDRNTEHEPDLLDASLEANSDTEVSSTSSDSLDAAAEAFEVIEQNNLPAMDGTALSENSRNIRRTENLGLLNQANVTRYSNGLEAAIGALAYRGMMTVARLQELGVYFPPRSFGPAFLDRMRDISAWIRANPRQAAFIIGGISVAIIACATPAILGAVGFGAYGPIAGSLATAWQASIGSIVAGTPFALLQSMAMGGAAMGAVIVIGAGGAGVAAVAGLASNQTVRGVVERVKEFVEEEVIGGIVRMFKGFFGG